MNYAEAGVSLDRSDKVKNNIAAAVKSTFGPRVLGGFGGFGGCFDARNLGVNPVLVSSCDGVGTKLKLAFQSGIHTTVGQDIVNHCVDDILVQGAKPLFFLDYIATGRLQDGVVEGIVEGIAKACRENGASLIGGETAEMPGLYEEGEYDLAGFIVGCVERGALLTGARIAPGHMLFGLPSTGLHTNGYSLARKLFFEVAGYKVNTYIPELDATAAEELLKVHRSYLKPIQALLKNGALDGAAHITGGGITDNLPRILPAGCAAEIQAGSWPVLPVFELLRRLGNVPVDDWRRTFNLGIGMILAVPEAKAQKAARILKRLKQPWYDIGRVVRLKRGATERVVYR
jgi:phosphoribosylformylglycinamidine cyclo-ligase